MDEIDIKIQEVDWKHAEAVCNAKLIELGYDTYLPFTGGGEVDIIAVKGSEIKRVQVKSVSPNKKDVMKVHLYRSIVNFKTHAYKPYENIDWFLVYDGTNIYKFEASEVELHVSLRYTAPRNNQLKNVRMASDFII
tara:strand:+ start:335 stop:742 length:408 start_codon:yes stop_codon:yes gene_type:complete